MKRKNPSLAARIVWLLFCLVMYLWAIAGPFGVVIGTLSFFVEEINFNGASVKEKIAKIGALAVFGLIGIGFIWLRSAGYLIFTEDFSSRPHPQDESAWTMESKRRDAGGFQAGEPPP